jgi:hypothetical protein
MNFRNIKSIGELLTKYARHLEIIETIDKEKLAEIAQTVYDAWDASDKDYGDWQVGFGGICHLIAEKIVSYLDDIGIYAQTVSSDAEVHVYVVAKTEDGVYLIDIPPHLYETGGGYNWEKIPEVVFNEDYIVIHRLSSDPKDFREYVEYYEEDEE